MSSSLIQLESLSKRYGKVWALDDLSVSVRPGAIGLLGPNGAGKSTLIKLLLGLVRFDTGKASVLGQDVRKSSRMIRQLVGYMPEDDCFIGGMSGVETVAYTGELAGLPRSVSMRRAHEMLDYARLKDERYREVQTYSAGMKQRLKLAQALIHSPRLVFLDEPTGGLDPDGREHVLKMIQSLSTRKNVSVVLSTHILHDIEVCCESVLIVGRGKLLVYDQLDNLRSDRENSYHVCFEGDGQNFQSSLSGRGIVIDSVDGEGIRLHGEKGDVTTRVFEAASDCNVAVRQVTPARSSLEEIFLTAVGKQKNADR